MFSGGKNGIEVTTLSGLQGDVITPSEGLAKGQSPSASLPS